MLDSRADDLFVEMLRRGADLEAFCAEHPAEAPRLRELHGEHERVLERLRAAGITQLPVEIDPSSSLLESGSAASGELLRRIASQGPKGARYRMRGEIARGGMGAILRVWDDDLGRELAMKVALGSDGRATGATPHTDGRSLARFLEEAQVTGQLDHPCVVPVHELGLDEQGQVYFTMRLVHGRDLGRIFQLVQSEAEGWTRTRALGVLLRVCEAVAFAHSKGVLHRDLKPANVMVGGFGEVYVMDWGLARVVGRPEAHDLRLREDAPLRTVRAGDSESELVTLEGEVLGTPAYMPPEQAHGRIDELSPRSDVYAIGAMLYHLLAARSPYAEPGVKQSGRAVLEEVRRGPPRRIAELCADLPPELEAVCEKAMARDPAARYPDTRALADDLRAFLEGRVVRAYQTGALVELRKWVGRNRPLAAAGAVAILFLAVGLVTSLWQKSIADENAVLAATQAEAARQQESIARASQALAETRQKQADAAARRATSARDFLAEMLKSANPVRSASIEVKVADVLEDATQRLDAGEFGSDPGIEFALRCTLGDTSQGLGRFEDSERHYRRAEELLDEHPELDPDMRVVLAVDFADALNSRGKFSEAETKLRWAIDALVASGEAGSDTHTRALFVLGICRYNLGAVDEAMALSRRALARRIEIHGEDDERVAVHRVRIAFLGKEQGLVEEPLAELERALPILRAGSDRSRFEASAALRQRADLYRELRRRKEAREDLVEALALREAMTGPDSIFSADAMHDLASVEMELDMLDEAERHARRALEVRRAAHGDHRDTATALATLSSVHARRGRQAEARSAIEESLAIRRKVLPEGSAAFGDCYDRLASLARDEGDLDEARRLFGEAIANWERTLGLEHPDLARARFELGKVLRLQGDLDGAFAAVEKALATRVARLGATNPASNEARDELVTIALARKDWLAAEALLREVLTMYEQKLPAGHALLAYTGAQLGIALTGQGRLDEAEPLLLAGWKAIGEDPKFWAVNKLVILDGLVELHTARGDADQAAVYRERADALRK